MKKSLLLSTLAACGLLSSTANAGVPLSFTHQGLLKEDGNLVNGEREITAIIMDENDSEVARTSSKVPVDSGSYIMTITGIDSDKVANAQKLKLWVQVEGELLTPALTINSVPYALVANRAESVNTSGSRAAAIYGYAQDGGHIPEEELAGLELNRCPCDKDDNSWDCPESFENSAYNVAGCYDKYGPSYQYYKQNTFARPVETVVVENDTVGIGTAQPEAPLHIFSDVGETGGYDVRIGDPNPRILLDDLQGNQFVISGENGQVAVSSVTAGEETNLLVVNNAGVQVNGTFNATTVAGDMKINSENITDGSIVNDDIQNNTIKEEKLSGLYPAKAFASYMLSCLSAGECSALPNFCGFSTNKCRSTSSCSNINLKPQIAKNLTLTKEGAGVYRAAFAAPLATDKYAVVVTHSYGSDFSADITERTKNGFKVIINKTVQSIAVGSDGNGQTTYNIVNNVTPGEVAIKTNCEGSGGVYMEGVENTSTAVQDCNSCRTDMLNADKNGKLISVIVYE